MVEGCCKPELGVWVPPSPHTTHTKCTYFLILINKNRPPKNNTEKVRCTHRMSNIHKTQIPCMGNTLYTDCKAFTNLCYYYCKLVWLILVLVARNTKHCWLTGIHCKEKLLPSKNWHQPIDIRYSITISNLTHDFGTKLTSTEWRHKMTESLSTTSTPRKAPTTGSNTTLTYGRNSITHWHSPRHIA